MLGPMPKLHRWVVSSAALVGFVGAGAWLAHRLPIPMVTPDSVTAGATAGAVVGAVAVLLLLDGSGRPTEARSRARRTR